MSRVPRQLKAGIVAVLALAGSGAGLYYIDQAATERTRDAYVQAVARDTSTSHAVKVAMVMGSYYESSYKHIGTPYVDKLMNLPDASFACGFLRVFGGHVDAVS